MKAFENKTNTGTEPAVKKGTSLPEDAVNIGYFSSQEITPERHLSVTDLSSLIPENNSIGFANEVDTIMYADEFGVLRYAKTNAEAGQIVGSPIVNNSQVSLSNRIMNFSEEEINYNFTGRQTEFESQFFVHSYYVSTDYVLLSSNVSEYSGIESASYLRNPAQYNIKIVDESGKENETIKYKILLEKYTNNSRVPSMAGTSYESLDLYRIIVLLEKADPQNLYLIYDKYEKDEDNIPYNPFFSYKEKINSVPYFNYVAEESEVIDASSQNKKVYSTQIFSYKENELLTTRISNDGWKIYTPRKAIQDPRTFQSFNWRLIAKINYNFSQTRNIYSNDERPIIKVAVLYSGTTFEARNAYVFNNMQESVFNIQNYIFTNPNARPNLNESEKSYWLVDIDDLSISYADYDLLIWTPTRTITDQQASTIEAILSRNISVLIDMSYLNLTSVTSGYSTNLTKFGFQLSVQNVSSGNLTINETYKNGNTSMNAWSLSEYEETSSTGVKSYSLFGKRKDILNNNATIQVPTFVGTISQDSLSTSLVNIGANNSAIIKRSTPVGNLFPSSLIITATPFLQLVNDKVSADGTQTSNNGASNIYEVGTIGSQRITGISEIIVGPNKLFYNIISDINKTKVNNFSAQSTTNNSTILWNVSPWRNSWTINGQNNNGSITVLSNEEKSIYNFGFKTAIGSTTSKFSRQISPSITNLLLGDFENTVNGGDAQNIINQDFSNVDFYLESTNPNVSFINFDNINDQISSGQETLIGQVSLSYRIFKLSAAAKNQIINQAAISLDANSSVVSPELDISPGYPYIITTTSEYQERNGNNIRTPNDFIPGSQDARDYSFSLSTQVSVNEITQTVNRYRINWSTPFTSTVSGTGDFAGYIIEKGGISGSLARTDYSVAQSDENKIEVDKIYSPFNDYNYPSRIFSRTDIRSLDQDSTASSLNNFHYTGDIDAGNRWDEYRVNYDSGSSDGTVYEVPQSITYGAFFSKVYKGSKLTANDVYKAFIDPSFSWKTLFGQACMVDFFWYKDIEPEEFFILPYSIKRFTRKPITLVKYILNIIHPLTEIQNNLSVVDVFGFNVNPSARVATFFADTYNTNAKKLQLANLIMSKFSRDYYFVTQEAPSSNSNYSSSSGSDYIKYIQYTLAKQKYPVTVNGRYDRTTHLQVKNFQTAKSQSFIDGIVDSETKSVLATYWLNLYKNNIDRFNLELNAAPAEAKKYILKSVEYSDISNIGIPGKEYRRISFTGVTGPTEIVDYIICKVPQVAAGQKVHSVTVKAGGWSTVVESVYLYEQNFDIRAFFTNTVEGAKIPNAQFKVAWHPGNSTISANRSKVINFDTYDGVEKIQYAMIKVKSKKLPSKYGPNAEGFSISDITFSLSADGTAFPPKYGGTSGIWAVATGTITGYTEILSSQEKVLDLVNIQNAINSSDSITSVQVNNISFTVSNGSVSKTISHTMPAAEKERRQKLDSKYSFTETYGADGNVQISIDPIFILRITSPTISSAQVISTNAAPASTSSSNFSINLVTGRDNFYTVKTTNGIQYDSVETSPITPVENFYLADADNISSRQRTKLTINVRDGITVLTDANGRPTGFPNFNGFSSSNRFGFINLLWSGSSPSPYGLDWQFIYINPTTRQRTFLGRKITYLEYMEKGPNNVFIGLNAFDADMSAETGNNIVGETSRNRQLQLSNRPTRYLCPVYSVKVANRPKIAIGGPSNSLSKFDTWYVNLTQGKFIKTITVPTSYNFTTWLKEYKGKQLKCYYDTTSVKTPYSSIFGFGYYDVYEENPRIISDNEIKLRYGKVHSIQEQYDKQLSGLIVNGSSYTDASPIVPWIKVHVKNTNGKWVEVPRKDIRSFDKHKGTIIFKRELVPLQEKDIKVSYTIKNDSAMIHQINGKKLELNPYNSLALDKPLFIYLLPVKCEQTVNGEVSSVESFTNLGPIHFTYDASIFNINSNNYNPLALHLSTIKVNNLYNFNNVKVEDMRVRGGGIKHDIDILKEYELNKEILSFADLYSGKGFLHANGGYVIVKIPKEVINNFNSKEEVYNIVRNNLTAGVSFDIQDVDGTDWRSIINVE